jgi:isopenicillin N synthase-like dioxygenase
LQALAVHLGQKRAYFEDKVDEGNSILRVIHYPPLARAGEDGEQALARAGHVRWGAVQVENPV